MRYSRMIGIVDIRVSLLKVLNNITKCFILAFAFLAISIVITFGQNIDNVYSASTTLYYVISGDNAQDRLASESVTTYASLINSQKVAERAVSIMGNTNLSYRDVMNMVSYYSSATGVNLTIRARSVYADDAVNVANAVASAFIEEIRTMTGTDAIQILSSASGASISENGFSSLWKKRIFMFVAGFMLMAFLIFVKELFSDKIRSTDQCFITDDDVILGVIPEIKQKNE